MPGAARVSDNHVCPMVDPGPKPHVGGPVMTPCSTDVNTHNLNQARATDKVECKGPPDFIVTGSPTVLVNGLMAARMTDKTMHGGSIVVGSSDVEIGGGTAGATLGNTTAGAATFQAATAGRAPTTTYPATHIRAGQLIPPGTGSQSYQNCGVESARQIINQVNPAAPISQEALLNLAMANGWAEQRSSMYESGGTSPGQRRSILARQGVSSTLQDNSMRNITQAVAEGRGVITSHDVSVLWGPGNTGGHAILATGLQYDANGALQNVIVNDTGLGVGSNVVRADTFENSLRPGRQINVTSNPIW